MKQIISFLVVLIVLFSVLNLCAEEKNNIAVMDLSANDVSPSTAIIVSDILRRELVNTKRLRVLERKNMEVILKEQVFQQTGCTTTDCAVEVGKILNVQKVLIGSISKIAGKLIIEVRLVDVEKADIWIAESVRADTEEDLDKTIKELAIKTIKKVPLKGQIILVEDKNVIINLGKDYNLIKGLRFDVYKVIKEIYDENKKFIMKEEKKIGEIEIANVDEENSKAEIIYADEKIEKGNLVNLPLEGSKILSEFLSLRSRWSVDLLGVTGDMYSLSGDTAAGGMFRVRYFLDKTLRWSIDGNLGIFFTIKERERNETMYDAVDITKSIAYLIERRDIFHHLFPITINYHFLETSYFYPYVGIGVYYLYTTQREYISQKYLNSVSNYYQLIAVNKKYFNDMLLVINVGFDLFKGYNPYFIIDFKYFGKAPIRANIESPEALMISIGLGLSF